MRKLTCYHHEEAGWYESLVECCENNAVRYDRVVSILIFSYLPVLV